MYLSARSPAHLAALLLLAILIPAGGRADTVITSAGPVQVVPLTKGLQRPWGIGILPDGTVLVTERGGNLLRLGNGRPRKIAGVPDVWARGQGGLLDITIPRDFATTREIFLTYAKPQPGGAGTALAIGRLSEDGNQLTDLRTIFEMTPGGRSNIQFGSRVVEARDGTLFLTIGDRREADLAQDLSTYNGTVVRLNRDGTIPPDNPFVGQPGARPEIWSYGHRNPQGAGLDADGRLWVSEHGAQGGDEVNLIQKSANYGWPVISYGVNYDGSKIGEGTAKPGMEQPAFYWDPSMAPSGLMVYSGKLWPDWEGDIFVGALKFNYIARLDGSPLREVEQIKGRVTGRVRDIVEGPDGAIWFLSVRDGAVYRMTPG